MLKRGCILSLVFITHFTVYASGPSASVRSYSSPTSTYVDGATRIIELILETVGLRASFEVKKANVPNAAAVVYQGKRYILYNPSFIAAMDKAAGTPWASVAVLAHEIGHHLNGHTLDGKGSLPAIELEADEFSGFALRKMGASLSEAQVAMRIIASARATRTLNKKTGGPVEFYVNTSTSDTVFGRGRFIVNSYVIKGDDGKWKLDDGKVKVDGDELKVKVGDQKFKIDGDEIKIKNKDGKVKYEDGKTKIKTKDTTRARQ